MRFPRDFWWGAATAAHQIEGNNVRNDWWRAEEGGLLPHRSGDACDSWNRWADDIRLLQDMGLNAYRFSVEWARIEPEPGRFDHTALDTYGRMLEAMHAAGIEIDPKTGLPRIGGRKMQPLLRLYARMART